MSVKIESPDFAPRIETIKIKLASELSQKAGQLKLQAEDGKMRITGVADTEQLFRLIRSIPSPKATTSRTIAKKN